MARKLRSAGLTPQNFRAELSSNGYFLKLRGAGLTRHFHAELPSNGHAQWKPSMESFRKHEEIRLPHSSQLFCVMWMMVSGHSRASPRSGSAVSLLRVSRLR